MKTETFILICSISQFICSVVILIILRRPRSIKPDIKSFITKNTKGDRNV